jgi:hypothetical protein
MDRQIYIVSISKYFQQEEIKKKKDFPTLTSFQKYEEVNLNYLEEFEEELDSNVTSSSSSSEERPVNHHHQWIKLFSKKKIVEKNKGVEMTYCLWWKTFDNEHNYLIVTTEKGNLIFFNLQTQNVDLTLSGFDERIQKIEMITDFKKSTYRYLLVHSKKGKFYQLLLEQFDFEFHHFKTILEFFKENENLLNQFNSGTSTSSHEFSKVTLTDYMSQYPCKISTVKDEKKGNCLISLFSKRNHQLSIYDNQTKYPLYVYQLNENTKKVWCDSDSILFSIQKDSSEVWIISKILAGTSFDGKMKKNALFQKISLKDEKCKGILKLENNEYYLYTLNSIYRMKELDKIEIFHHLILNQREKAEVFGKSFSLDILNLYEKIGNDWFEKKDYENSISLFKLSNIENIEFVKKLISIGKYNQARNEIIEMLKNPATLQNSKRIELSNLLFDLFIFILGTQSNEQNPTKPPEHNLEEEFQFFLFNNAYYSSRKSILKLIKMSRVETSIRISHLRNEMSFCFQELKNFKIFNLSKEIIQFLLDNQYHSLLESFPLNPSSLDPWKVKETIENEDEMISFLSALEQDDSLLMLMKKFKNNKKIYFYCLLKYICISFSTLYQEKLENEILSEEMNETLESFIIKTSVQFKNYSILSLIFERKEEYIESLTYKLMNYKKNQQAEMKEEDMNEMFIFLENIIKKSSKKETIEYQKIIFSKIISFFKEKKLNFNILEEKLNFKIFGDLLSTMLMGQELNHFSNEFYLKISKYYILQMKENQENQNLQLQIFQNIQNEILKVENIQHTPGSVASLKLKIFTCGHSFDLLDFKDKILIEFRSKLREIHSNQPQDFSPGDKLKPGVEDSSNKVLKILASTILQDDYQQNISSNSCPLCTLQYLTKK